jgi:uncharacterized protein (DUF1501 family)
MASTAYLSADRTPAPVLVSVFLRGGADGLHLVPPVADAAYHRARPTIAVAESSALRLDDVFALHPDLAPLHAAFADGDLSIVHQCGTAEDSRSHFSAEDYLLQGGTSGGGWIGRYLHHHPLRPESPLSAVTLGTNLCTSLRGVPAVALRTLADFSLPDRDPKLAPQLRKLYALAGGPLGEAGATTLQACERIRAIQNEPGDAKHAAAYPKGEFGQGLALAARLIRADIGLRAATIELGGWDSHFTQLTLVGGLVGQLAQGLAAFRQDMGSELARAHVVVTTEFGRRVAENVSVGTDHGRASVLFHLTGKHHADSGRVLSEWAPSSLADDLEGPGDVTVKFPMPQQLGKILRHLNPNVDAAKVFPGLA